MLSVVCLHGNHHAVRHAFGANIIVVDVDNVSAVAVFIIYGLVILATEVVVP